MSVIILASDSPGLGRELAERTARRLGCGVVGPEILPDVAERLGVSESALVKALDERPRLLGLSAADRSRYLAAIREATLTALVRDEVVCHGLSAELYVHGISHVLKVRVLADPETAARELAARERIQPDKASKRLARRSAARRRWSLAAFELDETDPSIYDLVVKLGQIGVDRALGIIADTVSDRGFQPMTYSQKLLADRVVEARARTLIVDRFPGAEVVLREGTLEVAVSATEKERPSHIAAIEELVAGMPEIDRVAVEVSLDYIREAAEGMR